MAVTQNSYVGNGSTTTYSFTFPYLKAADIKAQLDATVTTAFTLPTATTLQFNTAPGNGVKIKIYRETSDDALTATFYAGSSIKSEDLNDNFTQNLYSTQEISARYLSNLGGTMVGDLTMGEDAEILFEGATDDAYETKLTVADPTADRTITLPNETGTVVTTGSSGVVTSTMITDGTIVDADIANTTITGGKLVNDTITATQIAANAVTASELADDAVDTNAIANDAVTYGKIQNVTATDRVLGRDSSGAGVIEEIAPAALRTMINVEDGATADQTNAEIRAAVEAASDSNVFTDADHTKLNAIEASADVTDATNVNAAGAVMNSDTTTADMQFVIDEDNFSSDLATKVPTQQSTKAYIASYSSTTSQPVNANLTTLAGMESGTASILASDTALTSTTAELNLLDGKSIVTTISGSSTDAQLPTAQAVDERITALVTDVGGFVPIANETSFPATNPDPEDNAGTIVSVKALASNLTSNGSGVATIANGAGSGNTVTINGMANSDTIEAGKGILVETTSTLHTYTFHRETLAPADVTAAKSAVDDFNQRYQVAGSTPTQQPDGTALAEGDLFFDTAANKMKVYDGSNYGEVTSTGDYKYLFLCPDGGSGAPTLSNTSFDLREGSNSGSAANVTNAAQLLVSINGVIQKANTGTTISGSDEGFVMADGNNIKFATAPGVGSSIFIVQIGSAVSIPTPGDNTVSEVKIQNLAVSTGKIADQAVDLTKLPHGDGSSDGKFLRSNNGADPTWETASSTPTTTRGDIIYRGASADQRLAKGTAGQFLKIGANDPEWADVQGAVAGGVIYENDLTIGSDYTIASTKGAHSVGPITLNATVTVNGRWVIS